MHQLTRSRKVVTEEERRRKENNFQEIIKGPSGVNAVESAHLFKGLPERQRRSILRRIERGEIDEADVARIGTYSLCTKC